MDRPLPSASVPVAPRIPVIVTAHDRHEPMTPPTGRCGRLPPRGSFVQAMHAWRGFRRARPPGIVHQGRRHGCRFARLPTTGCVRGVSARLGGAKTLRCPRGASTTEDGHVPGCRERALGHPETSIQVPRRFDTEFNVSITAACLGEGYLRVQPRDGDVTVVVRGKRYIRTAAPVETRWHSAPDGWVLELEPASTTRWRC